jgi:subtilisin family serine protease
VRDSGFVISTRDYVHRGDTLVHDPDSVVTNIKHVYYRSDNHGTQTLGLVAGYDPGAYMGAAWGARFMLARTEDIAIEARVEEDNWAAAVVWAESLGVQIISSSLGYREFDDPDESYGFKDMDGATTIVSRAAAGAVARGVIVVNSAGNEGNNVSGTLSAPADVDGVVAVGAVDRSRALTMFSSSGPSYDGRMKPDLVAPGSGVPVLGPYVQQGSLSTTAYTASSGTSFSAPIVSGILALILQANPGISPEEARERLYRSCSFAARQQFADSKFGHGIPNALLAMMAEDEIFVKIVDSSGAPLIGAKVVSGELAYTIDSEKDFILDRWRSETLPRVF